MRTIAQQCALITGAGRGIGKALALRLAAEGARVVLVARSPGQLEAVAGQVRKAGGEALVFAGDVTERDTAQRAIAATTAEFGPVTILVNNAGIPGPYGPIGTLDPHEWWAAQELNVRGALLFMSAAIPGMRERGFGRIINIVSSAGLQAIPYLSAYAISKCTLIRLTETVDLEQRDADIRAFALQPGTITTDMAHGTISSPEAQRWLADSVAWLRSRTPEQSATDLARCCDVVAAFASGKYDALAGRYLDVDWDLDAKAREA